MKYKILKLSTIIVMLNSTLAVADFTVQIGAMKELNTGFEEKAAAFGQVEKHTGNNGFTLYQVGHFKSKKNAELSRDKLRETGYKDAFVRTVIEEEHDHSRMSHIHGEKGEIHDLTHLSEEARKNVVFLDGRLHIKLGEQFIPLSDYKE